MDGGTGDENEGDFGALTSNASGPERISLGDTGEAALGETAVGRRRRTWWPIGLVAVLLAGVAGVQLLTRDDPPAASPVSAPSTTQPASPTQPASDALQATTSTTPAADAQPTPTSPGPTEPVDMGDFPVDGSVWIIKGPDVLTVDLETGEWANITTLPRDQESWLVVAGRLGDGVLLAINGFSYFVTVDGAVTTLGAGVGTFTVAPDRQSAVGWSFEGTEVQAIGPDLDPIWAQEVPQMSFFTQLFVSDTDVFLNGPTGGVFELDDGRFARRFDGHVAAAGAGYVALLVCGEFVSECRVERVDLDTDERITLNLPADSHMYGLRLSPNGRFAVVMQEPGAAVIDALAELDEGPVAQLPGSTFSTATAFTDDERWLLSLADTGLSAYDLSDGTRHHVELPRELRAQTFAIAPEIIYFPPESGDGT